MFPNTIMYGTELVTERCFDPLHAASGTVDHFRRDRYPIELCPQSGGLLTQGIVVCNCCDPCITLFAIKSATANQLICVFHNFLLDDIIIYSFISRQIEHTTRSHRSPVFRSILLFRRIPSVTNPSFFNNFFEETLLILYFVYIIYNDFS